MYTYIQKWSTRTSVTKSLKFIYLKMSIARSNKTPHKTLAIWAQSPPLAGFGCIILTGGGWTNSSNWSDSEKISEDGIHCDLILVKCGFKSNFSAHWVRC